MSVNELILTTIVSTILTIAFGWWYGYRIYKRPFDAHETWKSVVYGVSATLVLFIIPVTFCAGICFGLPLWQAALLASIPVCGFGLTGSFQIIYQVKKSYEDTNQSEDPARRYGVRNGKR